jgi:membrane-associated protease RseP (regulator of RpoE activity)
MAPGLQEELLAVPAQLFQGSLLLGSIAKLTLGDAIGRAGNVFVHPALIIGWCGLVTNALNCLPVGALDGGRMLQVRMTRLPTSLCPLCPLLLHQTP